MLQNPALPPLCLLFRPSPTIMCPDNDLHQQGLETVKQTVPQQTLTKLHHHRWLTSLSGMTAVACPEISLMLDATKAMAQHGKGLALTCPMDMKMTWQPHHKGCPTQCDSGTNTWCTEIAVHSNASALGCDTQDSINNGNLSFSIYIHSLSMYSFSSLNIIALSWFLTSGLALWADQAVTTGIANYQA
jgi:hypothetical protein